MKSFIELGKSDRVCWVCGGTGGRGRCCPECDGRGYSPKRVTAPDRSPETAELLQLVGRHEVSQDM